VTPLAVPTIAASNVTEDQRAAHLTLHAVILFVLRYLENLIE
jgi:hypothetical protein